MPQNTYLDQKTWTKSRVTQHAVSGWAEKISIKLRSCEMAFEEWVKGGKWEDITEVRTSQNEVMNPDFQVLLLSHALGFPDRYFPLYKVRIII